MHDAATLAVIRDIAILVIVALVLGVVFYWALRRLLPLTLWNYHGNVLSRPYGLPDAVAAALLVSFLTGSIFTTGAAVVAASPASPSPSDAEQIMQLVTSMSLSLLFAVLLMVYVRIIRDLDPVEMFGLRQHSLPHTIKYAVIGLAVAYAVVLVANAIWTYLLDGVWPDMGAQEPVQAFQKTGSWPLRVILSLYAAIVAPLVEEIMFRGFLYCVLKRFTDSYFAGLTTALLFGVVHMHVATLGPLTALGLVLVVAYELTGSLLVPVGIHALFNTLNLVLMVVAPEGQ
jgi:uncharacterized protein